MCGIAGMLRFDGDPADIRQIQVMTSALTHRGPDSEGYWVEGPAGFGHRRLSIIDVDGSPQPMTSHDGRYHVCFNGEILNYRQLREQSSYPFRTRGDTEVLLALFEAQGANGVNDLLGQFAYAIHDGREGDLWLFRDRLGILPLYYYCDDRVLLFGSEVKALLSVLPIPVEVDRTSVADYLTHRSVPAPYTLFKDIRKLPPGHQLQATPTGRVTTTRYWSVPIPDIPVALSDSDAVAHVGAALERSVARAMVADVPVGVYLSGGLDSSLIAALMVKVRGDQPIETFSAGFDEPRVDEVQFANQVSRLLGTKHQVVTVRPDDFESLWHRLTWHRDAPISEPADIAVFKLAALARQRVKVVLSGEGSDELFGGYPKHRFGPLTAATNLLPPAVRRPVFSSLERSLPARAARLRIALRVLEEGDERSRLCAWFAPFTSAERDRLIGVRPHGQVPEILAGGRHDYLTRMLYFDCQTWLPDNLLERGDRMSMAASLELRPPFLDHEVVRLAFSLPSRTKVRGRQQKWVVKEVARQYLPDSIVDRPKVGFRVPLDVWFRSGLRDMARDLLLSRSAWTTEFLDKRDIRALLESHERGRRNEEIRIWTLLGLEVWSQVFLHDAKGLAGRSTSGYR